MVRTILVPLDGSEFGEQALPLALGLARSARTALHLVHVHKPVVPSDIADGLITESSLDELARTHERAYLDRLVDRVRGAADIVATTALLDGPIAETLDQEAQARQAGLTVMTTHGRGPVSRFWLGSVADQLVRRASVPVLLVRPQETTVDLGQAPKLRHVLIPLDGSTLAEEVLAPVEALGILSEADYTLLQVIDPLLPAGRDAEGFVVSGLAPEALKHVRTQAESYLARIAGRSTGRPGKAQTRVIVSTQIAEAILEQARELSADLIAIATHGRGGIRRLLLGSVADKVLRGASIPVLVCRPTSDQK